MIAIMEQEQPPSIPPTEITLGMGSMKESDEKIWGLATHLSALVLPIIGPLAIYIINKETSPFVTRHAKASLNFQLSFLIWFAVCAGTFWLFVPAFIALALAVVMIIYSIMGGIKAHEGQFMSMPLALNLIK